VELEILANKLITSQLTATAKNVSRYFKRYAKLSFQNIVNINGDCIHNKLNNSDPVVIFSF